MVYSKPYLEELVKTSYSVMEVMRKANVSITGGNHRYWSRLIRVKHGIDTSHFSPNRRQADWERRTWQEVLVLKPKGSRKSGTLVLRRSMLEAGIPYRCACGNDGHWLGQDLVLEIDHINQNPLDDRRENLQFVCSNCHTLKCKREYEARRKPRPPKRPPEWYKRSRPDLRKVEWPKAEELKAAVWEMPMTALGSRYGVSSTTVKKWCKKYGIEIPPRWYWVKRSMGISHPEALQPTKTRTRAFHVNVLTPAKAAEIRVKIEQGIGLRQLARDYRCSYGTIYSIKTNRIYKVAASLS